MKDGITAAALRSRYEAETAGSAGYIWAERVQILEAGKVKKSGGNKAVPALVLALVLALVAGAVFFLLVSRGGGADSGAAQSVAEKVKTEEKKGEERPAREDIVDENGVQTGYVLYEYDETGRVIREEEFGMDDQTVRAWEYVYSADGSEIETHFYWHGEYTFWWVDVYDESGIRTEQRSYDTTDALTEICRCDADGNLIFRELYQGPVGAEWKYSEEELNEQGMPVKAQYFDENGEPDGSFAMEYDAQGRESRNVYHNAEGEFQWDTRSQYDENGNCVRREEYDENGLLEEYTLMEYRADGQLERQAWYSPEDALQRYSVTEFDSDGRAIVEKTFDAKDNLSSYADYVYNADGSYEVIHRFADGREMFRSKYDANGFYIA